jgi:FkbM family methyltransferase
VNFSADFMFRNHLLSIIQWAAATVYRLLGPDVSFRIAMSGFGKTIFRIMSIGNANSRIYRSKYGFSLKLSTHEYFMSGYFFLGETNPFETHIVRSLISSDDVFIDVGSHIGWYALVASQCVGPGGEVVAFEPNPACLLELRANVKRNRMQNIRVENLALSDHNGSSEFWVGDDMGGSFCKVNTQNLTYGTVHKIKVSTTTLDSYLKVHKFIKVRMIKIDVEGAETKVLRGSLQILRQFHPYILAEVIDDALIAGGSSARELFDMMSKIGYKAYRIHKGKLQPFRYGVDLGSINILFAFSDKELRAKGLLD